MNTQQKIKWMLDNLDIKDYLIDLLGLENNSLNKVKLSCYIGRLMKDLESLSEDQEKQDIYFNKIQKLYENIKYILDEEIDNDDSNTIITILKSEIDGIIDRVTN
jgi:hypothetical protein